MVKGCNMKNADKISRQTALWIVAWFLVLGVVLAVFGYWEMGFLKAVLHELPQGAQDRQTLNTIELSVESVFQKVGQALAASLFIVGLLLWLSLRTAVRRGLSTEGLGEPSLSEEKGRDGAAHPGPSPEEKEALVRLDQRRSLLLLSLLQREGRLVDFLQEDLQTFDDAQIGAAVRNIHETCRTTLNKYVAPEPIIDKEEGASITVDAGFDPNSIKLTGNVSGRPPFKGTLQHRGWRTVGLNLPTLSGSQDPAVIAPAEVEIE
jgi:hypothetical protein